MWYSEKKQLLVVSIYTIAFLNTLTLILLYFLGYFDVFAKNIVTTIYIACLISALFEHLFDKISEKRIKPLLEEQEIKYNKSNVINSELLSKIVLYFWIANLVMLVVLSIFDLLMKWMVFLQIFFVLVTFGSVIYIFKKERHIE